MKVLAVVVVGAMVLIGYLIGVWLIAKMEVLP